MYVVCLLITLLKFSTECAGGKFAKIGQYFAKIWTKVSGFLFWPTLYISFRFRVYM